MKQSRLHLLLLVSALTLFVIPACGDPEEPSPGQTTPPDNTTPDDGCGTGSVRASYMNGSQMCYATCTDDASCGTATRECKAADGANAPMICVPKATAPETCGAGEVRAAYQGGAAACYKTCTSDDACTGTNEVCRAADAGAGMICVPGAPPAGPCTVNMQYTGQIGGNKEQDGGTFSSDPAVLSADSGLKAVMDKILEKQAAGEFVDNDPATPTVNECDTTAIALEGDEQIEITEATVVATFGGSTTLQDQKQGMMMYMREAFDVDGNSVTFKVGQKVSFTVTGVIRFNCVSPQIQAISNLRIVSEDNGVYVQDLTGQDVNVADHYKKMVRIGGKVTSFNGPCGGTNNCYTLAHGEAMDKTIEVRTSSTFVGADSVGECWTYVGPVSAFPDFLAPEPKPQLFSQNFDWLRSPFRER